MKPFQANLVNATILIILGLWGYWLQAEPSSRAMIPVGFGVLFLLSTPPLRRNNRLVLYLLSFLDFLLLVALVMALIRAMRSGTVGEVFRQVIMILSAGYALFVYLRFEWQYLRASQRP